MSFEFFTGSSTSSTNYSPFVVIRGNLGGAQNVLDTFGPDSCKNTNDCANKMTQDMGGQFVCQATDSKTIKCQDQQDNTNVVTINYIIT